MFKRKNIITIVLAVFCFVLSACGNNGVINNGQNTIKKATSTVTYPLKVVDSYNRTITIEKEPKRIIAIAPNITEGIYALGKGTSLVGRSDYDDYQIGRASCRERVS